MPFCYKPLSLILYLFILANVNWVSLTKATRRSGITLDLIHRDSPLSPFYNPSYTHFGRLNSAFQRSFSRKSLISLAYKKTTSGSLDTNEIDAPIIATTGEFLMKIGIGTPPVDILAIADTGSDLTWTQCKPCTSCYNQTNPLFDPKNSKTYRIVSCQSGQCFASGSSPSCDSSYRCIYHVGYGDQSHSAGELAAETFTLGTNSSNTASFSKVLFGCGHDNQGTFNGAASGIIGLGSGSISIINQLNKTIGGKFSYCLTSVDSKVPSKISFGSDALVTGPNVLSTPLVRKSPDTYYFLTLEGVSVENQKFDYAPFALSKAFGEEGNIIIDSGTTLTFLPSDFYDILESALVNTTKGSRASDPSQQFQLCYDISRGGEFNPPPIVAHFSGADLVLPQESTFIEVQQGLVCLALLPSQDMAIFGNLNQINYHIGYDLENQKVNFLPTDCSKR